MKKAGENHLPKKINLICNFCVKITDLMENQNKVLF